MVFMGGTPLGSPFIGWIGEQFGARATLWLGGSLTVAGALLAWLLVGRRKTAIPGVVSGPVPILTRP